MIGGFRSDISITRKTDGNFCKLFPRVFCFPKSHINENGGNRKLNVFVFLVFVFITHENLKTLQKNVQKRKKVKRRLLRIPSTGTSLRVLKSWLLLYLIGRVRFPGHCGKMCSRHLFFFLQGWITDAIRY